MYWQETVVKRIQGQTYVNLRVVMDEYSICKGQNFSIMPTDTIDVHLTPKGLYLKDSYQYTLLTKDSIFVFHFQDGNYSYGRTKGVKSETEDVLLGQLLNGRTYRNLLEMIPFYLNPKNKKAFRPKEFNEHVGVDVVGNSAVIRYVNRKPWKEKFPDGKPFQSSENIVVWVDNATGLVTRVRKTIHSTSEGMSPSNDIVDIRISEISFEKTDIDESLYRKNTCSDSSIAIYNINKKEISPSVAGVAPEEENLAGFLDAPLIRSSLDTTTLRLAEGWVLVQLWTFGCAPCARFALTMEQERRTLGYRKLEHEGISVMCLNNHSSVTESFKSHVNQFNISDIGYSAKSILGTLNYDAYPYYILLSPDKKIVFRGTDLGEEYRNVLDAKKRYSR